MPLIILIFISLLVGCGSKGQRYQGYVEADNLYLASPYSGVLIERVVSRGQWVKKGDLIFKLEPNPEALIIAETEGELLQAKKIYNDLIKPRRPAEIAAIHAQIEQTNAQIRLAELRLQRMKTLYTKNAIDKESMDIAQSRLEELVQQKKQYEANLALAKQGSREETINAQQAQINALTAKVNQAKWQLAQKSVYAPADGIIFDTYYTQGEFVPSQQAVASLLNPTLFNIEFYVPAQALHGLALGKRITFSCDGCPNDNQAEIRYVSSRAEYIPPLVYSDDNLTKLVFRVRAKILNNPAQFKPGQPVVVMGPAYE